MPINLPKIKALCFDVDGTLSDTDDLFVRRAEPYFQRIRFLLPGKDVSRAARRFVMWAEAPGNFALGLPDLVGLDGPMIRLTEWFARHRPRPRKEFMLIPGVREMLDQLKGRYPMSVITARDEAATRLFLQHFGLEPYFDVVVTALTAPHTKPFPDPLYYAAKQMGVRPDECLMIGDTPVDIRAGMAAGAQTVGVLCGFGEEPELRKLGADLILNSTPDLVTTLSG